MDPGRGLERLLIIGCGSIGRRHLGDFRSEGIPFIAAADPRGDHLEQARNMPGGLNRGFTDYRQALAEERLDAVVISAPTHLHTQIAFDAAEAGCHIFMEKPVASTLERLDDLLALVRERNLVVFTAYCHRFIPSVERLKQLLDQKRVGKPYAVTMNWGSYLPNWHPWEDYRAFYMAKKQQGGGALLDESHGIDLLRHLFGEIDSVCGDVATISHLEIDSDDWASMLFRCKNGMHGKAHFDLIRHDPQIKLEVLCERGTLTWDRVDHHIMIYDAEKKSYEKIPYTAADLISMYALETRHFISCVRERKQPLIDLEDGIRTMRVVAAVLESSETGRTVSISNG